MMVSAQWVPRRGRLGRSVINADTSADVAPGSSALGRRGVLLSMVLLLLAAFPGGRASCCRCCLTSNDSASGGSVSSATGAEASSGRSSSSTSLETSNLYPLLAASGFVSSRTFINSCSSSNLVSGAGGSGTHSNAASRSGSIDISGKEPCLSTLLCRTFCVSRVAGSAACIVGTGTRRLSILSKTRHAALSSDSSSGSTQSRSVKKASSKKLDRVAVISFAAGSGAGAGANTDI